MARRRSKPKQREREAYLAYRVYADSVCAPNGRVLSQEEIELAFDPDVITSLIHTWNSWPADWPSDQSRYTIVMGCYVLRGVGPAYYHTKGATTLLPFTAPRVRDSVQRALMAVCADQAERRAKLATTLRQAERATEREPSAIPPTSYPRRIRL